MLTVVCVEWCIGSGWKNSTSGDWSFFLPDFCLPLHTQFVFQLPALLSKGCQSVIPFTFPCSPPVHLENFTCKLSKGVFALRHPETLSVQQCLWFGSPAVALHARDERVRAPETRCGSTKADNKPAQPKLSQLWNITASSNAKLALSFPQLSWLYEWQSSGYAVLIRAFEFLHFFCQFTLWFLEYLSFIKIKSLKDSGAWNTYFFGTAGGQGSGILDTVHLKYT